MRKMIKERWPEKQQIIVMFNQEKTELLSSSSSFFFDKDNDIQARHGLKPIILATLEAEISRILIQSQPGQKFGRSLSHWVQWYMAVILAM
jgi:hypothetical protein